MLTPHCSAASGMVAPPCLVSITRLRKSSEYGFAIHAGLLPVGSLNHIRAGMGIPDSAFSGNALAFHIVGYLPATGGQWLTENLKNALIINVVLAVFNLFP